ncbi:hypothetical protein LCGC14_0952850 [marine sediment metagenome]|uniref:Nudix hydrolase domain-containing protein n=1 Tax=marine sediment metagenome TaxID=412755 RepID=A0A0F9NL95_9ZZZZ
MQSYCVGFLFNVLGNRVLLLRKLSPAWQAGKYNGVGGKIEQGEIPIEAMNREWKEETASACSDPCPVRWSLYANIHSSSAGCTLYAYRAFSDSIRYIKGVNDIGEQFFQMPLDTFRNLHGAYIYNLPYLIHLALDSTVSIARVSCTSLRGEANEV